jgi:hypothetical protein
MAFELMILIIHFEELSEVVSKTQKNLIGNHVEFSSILERVLLLLREYDCQ